MCDELQHHHKQQLERRVQQAAHQARLRWNDHVTKTEELRYGSLHMEAICLSRGSITRSILHCCLLNPCIVVAQLVTSQPVTVDNSDILLTSWAQVRSRENSSHHPLCTVHLNTFCVVSHSCMVVERLILVSRVLSGDGISLRS